jgi:hypothetical protein
MSTLSQGVNRALPPRYVEGAAVAFSTVNIVLVGTAAVASAVRDTTDTVDIRWTGTLSANITVAGAGGLDAGVEAASTWYAIHVIAGSALPVAALLSLSATAPVLPAGYTHFRRVGWVRNDAGSAFVIFYQRGSDRERIVYYDASVFALVSGGAVVFTPVSLAVSMPPTSQRVTLFTGYIQATAGNFFSLRPTGSASGGPPYGGSTGVVTAAGGLKTEQLHMPTSAAQSIDYINAAAGGLLNIAVAAWWDDL